MKPYKTNANVFEKKYNLSHETSAIQFEKKYKL